MNITEHFTGRNMAYLGAGLVIGVGAYYLIANSGEEEEAVSDKSPKAKKEETTEDVETEEEAVG